MILSTHGFVGSQITQFVGLLDTYSGAAAAYSLRRLSGSYSGSAIRVRIATTGNPEYNIGFVDGELDVATLEGYCTGGLNAFVKTWYDQSGNARDVTQTTAANQPQIVIGGVVNLENTKPAIRFTGASITNLKNNSLFLYQSTFTLTRFLTRPAFAYIYTGFSTTSQILTDVSGSGYRLFSGANFFPGVNPSLANQDLIYSRFNGSSSEFGIDGNTAILGNPGTNVGSGIKIGTSDSIDSSFDGNMQELIFYNSNQSSNRTGIENNINDFYSIY